MRNKPKATVYIIFQTMKKLWTYKNLLIYYHLSILERDRRQQRREKKYSTEPLTKKNTEHFPKTFVHCSH